jgi:23S rRNA pseudouridine955/2504/2580 synthase
MKMKIKSIQELILFEDSNLLVINKPPFISSLDDRVDPVSVHSLAGKYAEGAQLCHRLDKETSGVMVIAKNADTYRYISILFEQRKVQKKYHALVEGLHDFKNLQINAPLITGASGKVRIDRKIGKESLTVCNTLRAYIGYTLVSCQLMTGRMHQIRVHLSSVGAPIAGDISYGGKPFYLSKVKKDYHISKFKEERPLIQRVALHARSISFKDPQGNQMDFDASYPKDFSALINQLEKIK